MADAELMARERLHLLILRQLGQALAARPYALKGGANLRFYFASPRFSEDMDLDVRQVAPTTLAKHVESILTSAALLQGLAVVGVRDVRLQPQETRKDTETTQRWKIHLVHAGGVDLYTKIEFSRRGGTGEPRAEAPAADVLLAHRLPPFIAKHYGAGHAIDQKIRALASPDRLAVRDIFDLHHLASLYPAELKRAVGAAAPSARRARDKALRFTRADFEGAIGPFLPAARAERYRRDPSEWERLQLELVERIDAASP